MAKGTSAGILIILGVIMVFAGLMWDASVGYAWQDLNNSTTPGTGQHAAVAAGTIFSGGYGLFISALGVVMMVGAVLLIAMGGMKNLGR